MAKHAKGGEAVCAFVSHLPDSQVQIPSGEGLSVPDASCEISMGNNCIRGSCVQELEKEEVGDKRSAVLISGHACETRDTFTASRYWTKGQCYDHHEPPIQVKISSDKAYIYCPNKTLQHRPAFWTANWIENPCPNYPFSLASTESFKINNFTYENTKITGDGATVASHFENSLLNDNLYPLNGQEEDEAII